MYSHLELSYPQLEYLINQLNTHDELYWMKYALRVPIKPSRVRKLSLYKQLAEIIHELKPRLSEWLRTWLSYYFTIIFQDGWETGDASLWDGKRESLCTVSVQDTIKKEGTYAAKVTIGTDIADHYGHYYKDLGDTYPDFYIGAYVYFTNYDVDDGQKIIVFGAGQDSVNSRMAVRIQNVSGTRYWSMLEHGGPTGYLTDSVVALTTWYWVEAHYYSSGVTDEIELFVEEASVGVLDEVVLLQDCDFVKAGNLYTGTGSSGATFYLDRFIFSDSYIGPPAGPAKPSGAASQILKLLEAGII